jgi:hypothetical protein
LVYRDPLRLILTASAVTLKGNTFVDDNFWQTLPFEFETETYRSLHPDLAHLSEAQLLDHYENWGREEGRAANLLRDRGSFVELIPKTATVLEIGPFCNPLLRGPNVSYFDVLSQEELVARARIIGFDPNNIPHIDYISETGDLSIVDRRFDVVVSSHCLEHQPDLVGHLQGAEKLLKAEGAYFILVPDKRYCFDHFIPSSNLAEVILAHRERRKVHTLRSLIEHRALTTHNDSRRHWQGDHGVIFDNFEQRVQAALQEFGEARGKYIDVHAWYLTPELAVTMICALQNMSLTRLGVYRIYATQHGANEFWMILSDRPRPEGLAQRQHEKKELVGQLRHQLANQIAETARHAQEVSRLSTKLNARNATLRAVTAACSDRTLWAQPSPPRYWLRHLRPSIPLPPLRKLQRQAKALIEIADRARDAGEWVKAAQNYCGALNLRPENAAIWVQFGNVLKASGRIVEAEAAYRRSLELDASIGDTHLRLAHVLKLQDRREEAVATYLRAIILDPGLSHGSEELTVL